MNKFRGTFIGFVALLYLIVISSLIFIFVYFCNEFWTVLSILIMTLVVQFFTGVFIFNNNQKLEIKLCWLIVVVIFPLLGTLFYVWFGLSHFYIKKWRRYINGSYTYIELSKYNFTESFLKNNCEISNIFAYNYSVLKSPIYINNSIKIIDDNINFLKETISLIRSAKRLIVLETYIFRDSVTARIIITELLKKRKEGVEIFVLYDWLPRKKLKMDLIKPMTKVGINVGIFNTPGLYIFKGTTNYRLHTKALIVDNQRAIFGGSNYSDEYIMMNKKCNTFRDLNFVISGEICDSLLVDFFKIWTSVAKKMNKKKKIKWTKTFIKIYEQNNIHKGNDKILMQLTHSSPELKEKTIEQTIISLIFKAKKSIYIAIPYLCPSTKIIDALNYSALSGVDVKIIVPGLKEFSRLALNVNRSYYQTLLKGKCKVYEYNGFIHSKYIIVDDNISYIGSSNIDYRSLWINFEAMVLIYNKEFNNKVKKVFHDDLLNSKEITLNNLNQVFGKKDKCINFFLRLAYPLI